MADHYRKKPIVIQAINWNGHDKTLREIQTWNPDACWFSEVSTSIAIPTLEGVMIANLGDYIIKGVQGEIYPCKSDIFKATYERVEVGEK